MQSSEFFELPVGMPFHDFFKPEFSPWEWVPLIKKALAEFDFFERERRPIIPAGLILKGDVFIHPSIELPPYGVIEGPAWIGKGTQLRAGVFIRGNVIVGEECVLGNSCEYKNCLLMNNVETAHFNYVGDSVLGNKAHLGAGVVLANVRLDRQDVYVQTRTGRVNTHLKKLGAIVGEGAEIGCNAVIQPGSILGKRTKITSNVPYGGTLTEGAIATLESRVKVIGG